ENITAHAFLLGQRRALSKQSFFNAYCNGFSPCAIACLGSLLGRTLPPCAHFRRHGLCLVRDEFLVKFRSRFAQFLGSHLPIRLATALSAHLSIQRKSMISFCSALYLGQARRAKPPYAGWSDCHSPMPLVRPTATSNSLNSGISMAASVKP